MERLTNHFDYCKMIDCKYYDAELFKDGKCIFFDKSITHCHEKCMNDKLRAYEDAEEQGLLIRLLHKIGDTVYWVEGEEVFPFEVAEMRINAFGIDIQLAHRGIDWKIWTSMDELGKKYFLTKEEAENALERMG